MIPLLYMPLLSAPPSTAPAEAAIRTVLDDFCDALRTKDRAKFQGLFLDGPVVWQKVHTEAALQGGKAKGQTLLRVPPAESHVVWFDRLASKPGRVDETFQDLHIRTDGHVAAATFRYTFQVEDRVLNHGTESCHLVLTDKGWKIVSVIWSVARP